MKKNMNVDFYKKHDFGDEMREAVESGRGARSEARKAEKASKAVTIRIPVRVIEGYKKKAASDGVGYQTLMNEVLEAALGS